MGRYGTPQECTQYISAPQSSHCPPAFHTFLAIKTDDLSHTLLSIETDGLTPLSVRHMVKKKNLFQPPYTSTL